MTLSNINVRTMVSKILNHLYLGDWQDAQKFEGEIICVTQEIMSTEPEKSYWIPVIRTSKPTNDEELIEEQEIEVTALPHQIELITFMIDANIKYKKDTLIHCMAGIERSPLVVASYLHEYENMNWGKAYNLLKEKRPEVSNRLQWLNLTYDELQS